MRVHTGRYRNGEIAAHSFLNQHHNENWRWYCIHYICNCGITNPHGVHQCPLSHCHCEHRECQLKRVLPQMHVDTWSPTEDSNGNCSWQFCCAVALSHSLLFYLGSLLQRRLRGWRRRGTKAQCRFGVNPVVCYIQYGVIISGLWCRWIVWAAIILIKSVNLVVSWGIPN